MTTELGGTPLVYTDEDYLTWLEAMRPYLVNGNSLYYSMKQAGLVQHRKSIYEKYARETWFREKVDDFRREPGELVNDVIVTQIRRIFDKVKRQELLTPEENKLQMFYAEKSRSAQPFFVNRQETAQAKPIEDLLDDIEHSEETENDVATKIKEQMVEAQPPLQNQE